MVTQQNVRGTVAANLPAVQKSFYPLATIKCEGPRAFRCQVARDVACLLDVDPSVRAWVCNPTVSGNETSHVPDFAVFPADSDPFLLDAPDRNSTDDQHARVRLQDEAGWRFVLMDESELRSGHRLANAKDLLRYGNHKPALGDRVRLLAALDENGSLPFSQCLQAFQETKPIAGLASLILQEYVEIDLDDAQIGPETLVRRR